MPGGRLPDPPSDGCSSTPVKAGPGRASPASVPLDSEVLSDDEDRFSLLSPIYSSGSGSDDDAEPRGSHARSVQSSESPVRCELPRTPSDQILDGNEEPACSPGLSAWELWLVRKAKEDRLNMQKRAQEESILKERKGQEEMQREQKKSVMKEKIREWLTMKKEQEIENQLARQRKEEEERQKKREKERENEEKAQQKYKNWLKKKNQEKMELEKKEKEEAALKEEQERERRKRAEEKFKEWLAKANEKSRDAPKTPCSSTNPFDRSVPSPSYFNPIPWKPIHIPPPEKAEEGTSGRRPRRPQRPKQSAASRLRPSASPGQLHWR